MIVVVAEKPSVGRDIARVLHCTEKGDGFLKGPDYTVTWAVGHLVTLCEPDEIDEKYKKWRMDDLPILPDEWKYEVPKDKKKQLDLLCRLMKDKRVDSVVCATDSGREGEYIYRLVEQMQLGNCVMSKTLDGTASGTYRTVFDADIAVRERLHASAGGGFFFSMNHNFITVVELGRPLNPQDGTMGVYVNLGFSF